MEKATKLMKILTQNYTKPISEKYANSVIKVATLEERISTFKLVGMNEKADKLIEGLNSILTKIRDNFKDDSDV